MENKGKAIKAMAITWKIIEKIIMVAIIIISLIIVIQRVTDNEESFFRIQNF